MKITDQKLYLTLSEAFGKLEKEFNNIRLQQLRKARMVASEKKSEAEPKLEAESTPRYDTEFRILWKNLLNTFNDKFLEGLGKLRLDVMKKMATKHKLDPFSYEGLEVLKFEILFRGFMELKDKIELSDQNFYLYLNDLEKALANINFLQAIIKSEAETVIVSIGSSGADSQQCPEFAKALSKSATVDIFNLDPGFEQNGLNPKLSDDRCKVYNFHGLIDYSRGTKFLEVSQEKQKIISDGFSSILNNILRNTHKRLIIINSISPHLPEQCCNLAMENLDKLGKQLEVVGGYFEACPAFLYSEELFHEKERKGILAKIIPAFQAFEKKYDGKSGKYIFSEKELEIWRKEYQGTGTIFENLQAIPTDAFFTKALKVKSKP